MLVCDLHPHYGLLLLTDVLFLLLTFCLLFFSFLLTLMFPRLSYVLLFLLLVFFLSPMYSFPQFVQGTSYTQLALCYRLILSFWCTSILLIVVCGLKHVCTPCYFKIFFIFSDKPRTYGNVIWFHFF